MANFYSADYGRFGVTRPGVGPVYINENEPISYGFENTIYNTNLIARGAFKSIDPLIRYTSRGMFLANKNFINHKNLSGLFGYDIGSTAFELATGKTGTAGNYISGGLGAVGTWAWNRYLLDQKGQNLDIGTISGIASDNLQRSSTILGLTSLTLSSVGSAAKFWSEIREDNRRRQKQANYNDGYSVYNLSRQVMSPNVLSQQDMANYSAIAKTVSQQLTYTQNPAVGYWNKTK